MYIAQANNFDEVVHLINQENESSINDFAKIELDTQRNVGGSYEEYVRSIFDFEKSDQVDERKYWNFPELKCIPDLFDDGQFSKMEDILEEALKKYPDFDFVYSWLSTIREEQGDIEEAGKILRQGLSRSKTKNYLCGRIAMLEYNHGQFENAVKWWIRSAILQVKSQYVNDAQCFLYLSMIARFTHQGFAYEKLKEYSDKGFQGSIDLNAEGQEKLAKKLNIGSVKKISQAVATLVEKHWEKKELSETDSASRSTTGGEELRERDNVGTRCETEDRGNTYFATLFQKDPEPILCYFFDTKEKATDALSAVSCMAVAKDSGKLICTEILTFGVFPAVDRDDSRTWGALLSGKSLTHDLWSEARECFKRHGGRMRREDEPPKTTPQQQTSTGRPNKGHASAVTFVEDIDLARQGGIGSKKIYKAPDKESALEFLKSQDTSRPYFYVEIETPSGWVGNDKDGIYEF